MGLHGLAIWLHIYEVCSQLLPPCLGKTFGSDPYVSKVTVCGSHPASGELLKAKHYSTVSQARQKQQSFFSCASVVQHSESGLRLKLVIAELCNPLCKAAGAEGCGQRHKQAAQCVSKNQQSASNFLTAPYSLYSKAVLTN